MSASLVGASRFRPSHSVAYELADLGRQELTEAAALGKVAEPPL
ncbi:MULTISPECIES: hypothetical protein [Rhizobium]|nr:MULTISPECIES: hypothetical protein [Rhizobium]